MKTFTLFVFMVTAFVFFVIVTATSARSVLSPIIKALS